MKTSDYRYDGSNPFFYPPGGKTCVPCVGPELFGTSARYRIWNSRYIMRHFGDISISISGICSGFIDTDIM